MANCSNCGEPLKEGVKFCTSCGTAVKGGAPAKSATATKSVTSAKSTTASDNTPTPAEPAMPARSVAPETPTQLATASNEVITTLGWFGTLFVLIVPIVGIVLYFVWAFGTGGNLNRRNYCRAALIMMAISIVLGIIFSVMMTMYIGALGSLFY